MDNKQLNKFIKSLNEEQRKVFTEYIIETSKFYIELVNKNNLLKSKVLELKNKPLRFYTKPQTKDTKICPNSLICKKLIIEEIIYEVMCLSNGYWNFSRNTGDAYITSDDLLELFNEIKKEK